MSSSSSIVIPWQFPAESSHEYKRTLSDRELWRSCGIHRTIVTFVTLPSISSLPTTRGCVSSTECQCVGSEDSGWRTTAIGWGCGQTHPWWMWRKCLVMPMRSRHKCPPGHHSPDPWTSSCSATLHSPILRGMHLWRPPQIPVSTPRLTWARTL